MRWQTPLAVLLWFIAFTTIAVFVLIVAVSIFDVIGG